MKARVGKTANTVNKGKFPCFYKEELIELATILEELNSG